MAVGPPAPTAEGNVLRAGPSASSMELAPDEFIMTLDLTDGGKLGLDVDWRDGRTLYVKRVLEGSVRDWCTRGGGSVRAGDRIMAINGFFDDPKAMLAEVESKKQVELLIRTPRNLHASRDLEEEAPGAGACCRFDVALNLTGSTPLGLTVDWTNGVSLYVTSVQSGGVVHQWNKEQSSAANHIGPGCRIFAVNGVFCDPVSMLSLARELIRAKGTLELSLFGPPPPPGEAADDLGGALAESDRRTKPRRSSGEKRVDGRRTCKPRSS